MGKPNARNNGSILDHTNSGLTIKDITLIIENIIDKKFIEIRSYVAEETREIVRGIEFMNTRFEETLNEIKSFRKDMSKLDAKIEINAKEVNIIKSSQNEVFIRLNELENFTLSNCFEISGIDNQKDVDLKKFVEDIAKKINIENTENLKITEEYTPKQKLLKNIQIRCKDATEKKMWIEASKKKKEDLTYKNLNLDASEKRIYINECMPAGLKKMFWEIKKNRALFDVKYVWFKDGNLLIKNSSDKILNIKSPDDLNNLLA